MIAVQYNSRVLFRLATEARDRTQLAPSKLQPDCSDALAAIVFSALTLEAAIEELSLTADMFAKTRASPCFAPRLASTLALAEQSRSSVRAKFNFAKLAIDGAVFAGDRQPYQDFDDLIFLRDSIVHLKPAAIGSAATKVESRLRARNICANRKENTLQDWVRCVTTPAAATWACEVVHLMAREFRAFATDAKGERFLDLVWSNL